jgi:ferredoxin
VNTATETIRKKARALLEEKQVDVVLGYTSTTRGDAVPLFVTRPEDCDRLVFNEFCYVNLTNYLLKAEVKALGRPAIVSKGCDNRAINILIQEGRINRRDVYIIGVECAGMDKAVCTFCDSRGPVAYDDLITEAATAEVSKPEPHPTESMNDAERWDYWMNEFSRCIRCYACREVCPMCYCPQCAAEKNRPQLVESSATPSANMMWHLMRSFHHAGRCVECGECERACPMDIQLVQFMRGMHDVVRERFGSMPGRNADQGSPLSTFREDDKEDFFR